MNVRVGLIGAEGRMGKAIGALISPAVCFTRVRPVEPCSYVDVYIDFSIPDALEHNLEAALLAQKPIVIGTTGHLSLDPLNEAAKSIPVFYSANFSIGIALMRRAAVEFVKRFPDVEIIETHHAKKKDAPSGTALMLASAMGKVKIQSIRTGQVFGKHELHFHRADEQLTLIHEAQNCNAFAKGAILAARFLAVQSPGFYTMDNL